MKVQTLKTRIFNYGAISLPDPDASLSAPDVRDLYAGSRPELATAEVRGPTAQGDTAVYEFVRAVGTKGKGVVSKQTKKPPSAEEKRWAAGLECLEHARGTAPAFDDRVGAALSLRRQGKTKLVLPGCLVPWLW